MSANIEGPPLIPPERVAVPRIESSDKATRKMIAQLNKTLTARFDLQTTGKSMEFHAMRFAELTRATGMPVLQASLRVSQKDYVLKAGQPVKIISGMCMFGASGLVGETIDGEQVSLTDPYELKDMPTKLIVNVKELEALHPSETEAILLLTDTFKALNVGEVEIFFHLPKTEYKLYMLEPFQRGLLTADQVETLFAKIDKRAEALTSLVSKRTPMPLTVGSPLSVLEPLLAEFKGETTINQCLTVLAKDQTMNQVIRANQTAPLMTSHGFLMGMGTMQQLPGFTDLINLSYTVGYIGLAKDANANNEGFLAVEMAQETPIFEHSKSALTKMNLDLPLSAMYLFPLVVTRTGKHFKDSLFMHQSNGSSPLTENRAVVANRRGWA